MRHLVALCTSADAEFLRYRFLYKIVADDLSQDFEQLQELEELSFPTFSKPRGSIVNKKNGDSKSWFLGGFAHFRSSARVSFK